MHAAASQGLTIYDGCMTLKYQDFKWLGKSAIRTPRPFLQAGWISLRLPFLLAF
jgi:hypothetical protein